MVRLMAMHTPFRGSLYTWLSDILETHAKAPWVAKPGFPALAYYPKNLDEAKQRIRKIYQEAGESMKRKDLPGSTFIVKECRIIDKEGKVTMMPLPASGTFIRDAFRLYF